MLGVGTRGLYVPPDVRHVLNHQTKSSMLGSHIFRLLHGCSSGYIRIFMTHKRPSDSTGHWSLITQCLTGGVFCRDPRDTRLLVLPRLILAPVGSGTSETTITASRSQRQEPHTGELAAPPMQGDVNLDSADQWGRHTFDRFIYVLVLIYRV